MRFESVVAMMIDDDDSVCCSSVVCLTLLMSGGSATFAGRAAAESASGAGAHVPDFLAAADRRPRHSLPGDIGRKKRNGSCAVSSILLQVPRVSLFDTFVLCYISFYKACSICVSLC